MDFQTTNCDWLTIDIFQSQAIWHVTHCSMTVWRKLNSWGIPLALHFCKPLTQLSITHPYDVRRRTEKEKSHIDYLRMNEVLALLPSATPKCNGIMCLLSYHHPSVTQLPSIIIKRLIEKWIVKWSWIFHRSRIITFFHIYLIECMVLDWYGIRKPLFLYFKV